MQPLRPIPRLRGLDLVRKNRRHGRSKCLLPDARNLTANVHAPRDRFRARQPHAQRQRAPTIGIVQRNPLHPSPVCHDPRPKQRPTLHRSRQSPIERILYLAPRTHPSQRFDDRARLTQVDHRHPSWITALPGNRLDRIQRHNQLCRIRHRGRQIAQQRLRQWRHRRSGGETVEAHQNSSAPGSP